jgi:hypothetical protein
VSPRFRRPGPDPVEERWASIFIASLYFLSAAFVVYFRVAPFRRVLSRAVEAGVQVPPWTGWAANAGTLVVAAYFLWRGRARLRGRPSTD